MNDAAEFIELEVRPIPPDTVASAKQDVVPLIEEALRNHGPAQLLPQQQVLVEVQRTFPTNEAIIVGLTFLAGVGLETYKFILDVLRERFEVEERTRGTKPHAKKR
jgi:c-di-GMP-related signal transduction protein